MAGVVRINGLVRIAGRVRGVIGAGLRGAELDRTRNVVASAIAQVDAILKSRGAQVGNLARPSQQAYQYLLGIDWSAIHGAVPAAGVKDVDLSRATSDSLNNGTAREAAGGNSAADSRTASRIRWSGLGSFVEKLMLRLSRNPSAGELEEIRRAIDTMSGRMEGTIRRQGIAADGLSAATREWRGWLGWMSAGENVVEYLKALARARGVLEDSANAQTQPPTRPRHEGELLLDFRPMRFIYRLRNLRGATQIMMPSPMLSFDEAGFADLAGLIFGSGKTAKQKVVERMREEAYADLMDEFEGLGGVVDQTRGAFHDLSESYARVNGRYFAGAMERPRLTWSRSLTRRKFGHFDHVRDWIMLSSTMDRADVPVHAIGNGLDEAEDEFLDALVDYAELWLSELRHAPNHRSNAPLVQRIVMYAGDRDELRRVVFGD